MTSPERQVFRPEHGNGQPTNREVLSRAGNDESELDETSRNVYLSDGGHIENLGIYELLKRGCELIVVVDAEADPSMSFGSLIELERYARIDLVFVSNCQEANLHT